MGVCSHLVAALLFFAAAAADPNDERDSPPSSRAPPATMAASTNCLSQTSLSRAQSFPYISNCTNLQALDLSFNSLAGPIPPDIQYLVNLAVLNLSSNRLSGPIPQQLALCAYLNVIDLHENHLSGPIPQQLGLLDLYGYPLAPMKRRGLSIVAIVGIGLGSGLVSLVLSFTAVCIWLRISEQKLENEEGKISQLMPDY
ncbi:Receptor-like protein 57 [Sesamum alatum]|uniref:Receptor-like protein 57 n=1 Tax=Sesamum alatum TaxID=300844 RepID=A0AAE1YRW3_9LAMI|nr:Receptor-like protein 57 [Sesamum alatum]